MPQRINISLPNDLFEELQNFPNLKPSKICQRALQNAIKWENKKLASQGKLEEFTKFLSEQQKETNFPFYEEGFEMGKSDIFQISYKSLEEIGFLKEKPKKLFFEFSSKETLEKFRKFTQNDPADFFFDGWVKGFISLWEEIQTKLSSLA